jgi:hypothetical protein
MMKTKTFKLEKFLDTAFPWPIRFRQKVLMVNFDPPLELFSLERKAVQLPDGLSFFPQNTIFRKTEPHFFLVLHSHDDD